MDTDGVRERIDVMFVCRANVSRSPIAAELLAWRLAREGGPSADWVIGSAGTHVAADTGMHPEARRALERHGVPDGPLRPSVQLDGDLVDRSGLLLTSTREQRAWIVERHPRANRRVFTLPQFARLCAAGGEAVPGPATTVDDLLERADAGRTLVQPVGEEEDRVDDPTGEGPAAFDECVRRTDACLDALLGGVRSGR